MLVREYLNSLPVSADSRNKIEVEYRVDLSGVLKQLTDDIIRVSDISEYDYFFSDSDFIRMLSMNEILYPIANMGIEFKGLGYLPLFDLPDNVFVVYSINKGCFGRYNLDTGDFYLCCSTLLGVLPSK